MFKPYSYKTSKNVKIHTHAHTITLLSQRKTFKTVNHNKIKNQFNEANT